MFKDFCKLLRVIRENAKQKISSNHLTPSFRKLVTNVAAYETATLAAVEERWAMFLRGLDDGTIKTEQAGKAYEEFEKNILKDYAEDKVIKNPYYHIMIGNALLIEKRYNDAESYFKKAIELDKNCCAAAFAGKAWALLGNKSGDYKQKAIVELNDALHILHDEIALLNASCGILQQQQINMESDLSKQLIQKINILGSYANSLKSAISAIKKSQRLLDVTKIRKDQDRSISESHFDVLSDISGAIDLDLKGYHEYEIIINDLTRREDSGIRDQAVETVKRVSEKLQNDYNDIGISMTVDAEKLKNILISKVILSNNTTLNIRLKELDVEKIKNKLQLMKPDKVHLEISGSKDELIKIVSDSSQIQNIYGFLILEHQTPNLK